MRLPEICRQTLRTLWAHKLRSFLTMFGIAWGVGSLLLLVGLGEGFRSGNRKQFDELGENVMFIWGGRAPAMRQFHQHAAVLPYLPGLPRLAAECPDVKLAAPVIRAMMFGAQRLFPEQRPLMGVPAYFDQIRYLPIEEGRWLNDLDIAQKRPVVVIGDEARRVLFPGWPSVGTPFCSMASAFRSSAR